MNGGNGGGGTIGSQPLTIIERTDAVFDWTTSNGVVRYVQQEEHIGEFPLIIAGGTYRVTLDGVTKEFVMQKKAEVNSNRDRYEFQLGDISIDSGGGNEGDYYITFFDNGDDRHFEFGIKTTDDTHNFKIEYIHKGEISLVISPDDLALNDEDYPENGYYAKTINLLISSDLSYVMKITINGVEVEEALKYKDVTMDGETMTVPHFGNMGLMGMGEDTGEQYFIMCWGGNFMINFSPEITVTDFKLDFLGLPGASELDTLETLIDESGVLEDTEGTVTEKVEELIGKAEELDVFMCIPNANGLFKSVKTFPSKAVVNLPNATNVYQCFSYWGKDSIPMVEEITVNAPNINVSNNQSCMGQMFVFNYCVKKIVLNMPDDCQYMSITFSNAQSLEDVVLNFSTKNITEYISTFNNSTVKRIIGILDFSSATSVNNMFFGCFNLEEVTFEPNTLSLSISLASSNKLTSDSIQSIINGLATVETAQNLTLHTAVVAKLTEEQILTIQNKNWNVL